MALSPYISMLATSDRVSRSLQPTNDWQKNSSNPLYLSGDGKADEKAARVLQAQWDRYQNLYTPVEDRLINSIGEDMTGQALKDARQSSTIANGVTDRMQERYGVAALPGQPIGAQRQRQRALNQAGAYNNASIAQVDRNQNIRSSLVDVGQGILNQATGGLSQAASMAGQREATYDAAKAQHKQAKQAQTASTVATVATIAAMMF